MRMDQKAIQIKVGIEKTEEYRYIRADGIYLSVTPRGEISMSFYTEVPDIPSGCTLTVEENMIKADQAIMPGKKKREMHFTAVVDPQNIEFINNWYKEITSKNEGLANKATDSKINESKNGK